MVSERIIQTGFRYPLVTVAALLFTLSGYQFGHAKYTGATILFIAGLMLVSRLMWLYARTDRTVTFFFNALRNNDTTLQFPVNIKNRTLARLHESMNMANKRFQTIKMQNEVNENYYRALIQHSISGLLVLNQDNRVMLINQAACRYAGISVESINPRQLEIKNSGFFEAVRRLKPGEDVTYKQITGKEYQLLTFRATLLRKDQQVLKLISVQDIRQEMESKEIESYRKLISVLTHEIMNLISPLTSVSKSLQSLFQKNGVAIRLSDLDEQMLATTQKGLQLIDEQGKGLAAFIGNYRKISRIPLPVFQVIDVNEWMDQLRIVYAERMKEHGISWDIKKDREVRQMSADKNLLNQVIINLMNNAIDAVTEREGEREINLKISPYQTNRVRISVTNNGPAIPPEIQDKIFVPFFTTKKNGSGIGLSICQEIMKVHKGSLRVMSSLAVTAFVAEV
jgi:signal transduction histidine kinase